MRVFRRVAENDGDAGGLIATDRHLKLAACGGDRRIKLLAVALAGALDGSYVIGACGDLSVKERDIERVNRTQASKRRTPMSAATTDARLAPAPTTG